MLKLIFIGLGLIMAGVHLSGILRIGAVALLIALLLKTIFRLSVNFVILVVGSACIIALIYKIVFVFFII